MTQKMHVELLSPAGNMDCLKTAVYFGADAVYLAAKQRSLRAFADNFSFEELRIAVDYAHQSGVKVYLAVNAFFHQQDFVGFDAFLQEVDFVDAIIVSDLGVLHSIKKKLPHMELHLSTQANITNSYAIELLSDLGISRVILARELTLDEIADIRQKIHPRIELEAFVHGAMCISYSGRCLLSGFFTGRTGNTGGCTQPCRWEYFVSERNYEGQYFPVMEDDRGTYVFNSKDLMMIEHLDQLAQAGISSFKIEGRMKSEYYVATTVGAYRKALDLFLAGKPYDPTLTLEATKAGTREYTTGFFFGNPKAGGQSIFTDKQQMNYLFAAKVVEDAKDGCVSLEQRNKFSLGDTLEIISPRIEGTIVVQRIVNENGEEQTSAPHAQQLITINCDYPLIKGDLLRKIR